MFDIKPEEVLIYLRKSRTDDPALSVSETLSKHEQMLDGYCLRTWGELVPEQNRFREIVSGETIEARPEIKKVLRLIEQDRFKAILIVEPQRLSRGDLEDIGRISKILRYTNTTVITLQCIYDLSDERDRDYFERELKRGNEYLEYQKRILTNGRAASVERGWFLGKAPYGYRKVWVKDGKRKSPSLEIYQDEAEVVNLIFRMYSEGNGATAICQRLNSLGIPAPQSKQWRLSTIYSMLDNATYIGKVTWQAKRTEKKIVDGSLERHTHRQKDAPMYEGYHTAIIPEALWDAVRTRRKASDIPRIKLDRTPKNPFAGIVHCTCGAAIVMLAQDPPRLRCLEHHTCRTASCKYSDFVSAVTEALKASLENIEAITSSETPDNTSDILMLKKRQAALAEKEMSLWEKFAEGMPPHIFEALLEKTKTEMQAVDHRLADEIDRFNRKDELRQEAVTLHEVIDMLPNIDDLPVLAANRVLKSCIKDIRYHRNLAFKTSGRQSGWSNEPIEVSIELLI